MVRGQYIGYRDEPGVDPHSNVETYIAARLQIDSWRWAGVPWYVRCGKALGHAVTEAVVELREPPQLLFDEAGGPLPGRNQIRFRLGKNDGVTFVLQAKTPGQHLDSEEVDIGVDFAAALGERQEAYERLIRDAIDGSPRRFARYDVVERLWGVVQPALDEPGDDPPLLPRDVGPVRGRPRPRRRHLVRTVREPRRRSRVPAVSGAAVADEDRARRAVVVGALDLGRRHEAGLAEQPRATSPRGTARCGGVSWTTSVRPSASRRTNVYSVTTRSSAGSGSQSHAR